jgi:hypothetical protein
MSIPFLLQLLLPTLCRTSFFYTFHQHRSSKTRTPSRQHPPSYRLPPTSVYHRHAYLQRHIFPTSIFTQRHFTSTSYSHPSEYSPPSDIILLPTLFRNLPTTLSDEDIFMTKTSTPPETSTTFYLPYYCPSAQDT